MQVFVHGLYDTAIVHESEQNSGQPTPSELASFIKSRALQLGFAQIGITDTDLSEAESQLLAWLDEGQHGTMKWMERHGTKRSRPADLVAGTTRVISVRMDYLPGDAKPMDQVLDDPGAAFVSRYALGRDYHKVLRSRLQTLARDIEEKIGRFGYRVFTDSAPVLEKPLAEKAGLGWIGKHTNLINKRAGSWFFLGEIYTDLDLPTDTPATEHCGSCHACIDACPTDAITAPFKLDARRCISYLTIEHEGAIAEEFRSSMGNRIYGCDDCQLVCPWNSFAQASEEPDFAPRDNLDATTLLELFKWTESEFLERTEGSAIRRIGHERWQRNIAIALGNAPKTTQTIQELEQQRKTASAMVVEHIDWALQQP